MNAKKAKGIRQYLRDEDNVDPTEKRYEKRFKLDKIWQPLILEPDCGRSQYRRFKRFIAQAYRLVA